MRYVIALLISLTLLVSILPVAACQPAFTSNFDVMSLDVTPGKVFQNSKFTVTATIGNDSRALATYLVTVSVDGMVDGKTTVMLEPGKSREVQFSLSVPDAGAHEIRIGDKTSVIAVEKLVPATFKLDNLKISADPVNSGEEVAISADITNTGGSEGSYTAELKINGITEQANTVTMQPGASFIVFKVTKTQPGTYSVNIGDLSGQFTVVIPVETPTTTQQQGVSQWGQSPPS